ncbi:hypothetical protein Bateq7PJ16_0402 [Bacillus subtilis]|nr:hypothetical protein Bateq7PJ16_0402 [Bacillus subtilis]BET56526.1 hypothetical protein BsubNA05_36320 [Bacillus subtilis]
MYTKGMDGCLKASMKGRGDEKRSCPRMNARRTKETHVDVKDAADPSFIYANTVRNGQEA